MHLLLMSPHVIMCSRQLGI